MNPSLDSFLVSPLVDFSGRLFCRDVGDGMRAVVGVLELPADLPAEHLALFSVGSRPQVDIAHTTAGLKRDTMLDAWLLGEHDLNSLLTRMKFAKTDQVDVLEMFVRHTHLEHSSPDMRWCQVAGASHQPLPSMPVDGLYDLQHGRAPTLVDREPHRGKNIGQVLREPIWGREGNLGFATSMEPSVYDRWVEKNREQNAAKDPMFAAFMKKMDAEHPLQLVYTRDEHQARAAASARIIREVMAEQGKPLGMRP